MKYDAQATEAKWQQQWDEEKLYYVDLEAVKRPYYTHVMFPYPSGDKLHVGHWYNFAPADSFARYIRMRGKDVLAPMGFDAFGLPAENYAIKTGIHPATSIEQNVDVMIQQLKRIGCMYDWTKTVNTSKPEYYRWTQWLFLQMFNNGLAYKKRANVNWCERCQTVLANEQAQDGFCERCESPVIQKPLTQWFFRITEYAERLLAGLESLDWPEHTKAMQRNWIGRSEGVNFVERVKDLDIEFEVYDSIPQTYVAQTFTIIAPEHPMVQQLVEGTEREDEVLKFVERVKQRKASGQFNIETDMEGIFTGRYVDNPFGTGDLPIWVASFVLVEYGTGIVNCSAHDERDFAFAKKYDIPLRIAMLPPDEEVARQVLNLEFCYTKDVDGIIQEPEEFKGCRWGAVREDIIDHIEQKGIGRRQIQYRLRDWLISRQRYWGAPIPIVYDVDGNPHPIPEEHLPWLLPNDVEFKPTGESPLAASKEFVDRTEKLFGKGWRPEVDTMDTFVCSSFYSLRYLAPQNENTLVDKRIEQKWMPVDKYIGGAEHACMHLIYARFVTMALHDLGFVSHEEPYQSLIHQGTITNDGFKMSKSRNNVVSPDSFVSEYGADVFRMYLMFMGPFEQGGDWSDTGIKGSDRFARRIYKLVSTPQNIVPDGTPQRLLRELHQTTKKVTLDMERLQFNTAIARLMEFLNVAEKSTPLSHDVACDFVKLLAPFAPHLAEELWRVALGHSCSVFTESWPVYDEGLTVEEQVEMVVQVNGKVRGRMTIARDAPSDAVEKAAIRAERVGDYLSGVTIERTIVVPNRLVNFIIS